MLDDLTIIQEKQPSIAEQNIHVFSIADAYRMSGFQNQNARNAGINPPNGVVVNYYVKNFSDSGLLNISVFDKNKKLIKSFSTKAPPTGDVGKIEAAKGMNQFVWDMFYPGAERIEGQILWNGPPSNGPKAPPGNYYVRIVSEKKDSTEVPFTIKANPNYKETQEEYEEQFSFLTTVKDKFSEIQKL